MLKQSGFVASLFQKIDFINHDHRLHFSFVGGDNITIYKGWFKRWLDDGNGDQYLIDISCNKLFLSPSEVLLTYEALEIPVIALSAETGEGMKKLKEQMKDKASVFSGQSGVGKSSLINTMTGLELPVGEVVKKTRKGVHTTSTTNLIPLSFGGWCIDTPGIRSFGIWDLKKEDLEDYFPEISEKSHGCKFPNCTHSHEPGCALEEALEKGEISPLRFDSYLKLLQEIGLAQPRR